MTFKRVEVHISDIKPGDVIFHDGRERTVCPNNIKRDSFMGTSVFGDSYVLGHKKVIKVCYPKR